MNELKFNFLVKESEEEMYNKIRERFIKNGYKPLKNLTYSYSFDCKKTKTSNDGLKETIYPYTLTIKYHTISTPVEQYKIAA